MDHIVLIVVVIIMVEILRVAGGELSRSTIPEDLATAVARRTLLAASVLDVTVAAKLVARKLLQQLTHSGLARLRFHAFVVQNVTVLVV